VILLRQGGWTRWSTEVSSKHYHSVILWLILWFCNSSFMSWKWAAPFFCCLKLPLPFYPYSSEKEISLLLLLDLKSLLWFYAGRAVAITVTILKWLLTKRNFQECHSMAQILKNLTSVLIITCKHIKNIFYSVFSKQEIKFLYKLYTYSMLVVIPTV